jgi:hypothetical protein
VVEEGGMVRSYQEQDFCLDVEEVRAGLEDDFQ